MECQFFLEDQVSRLDQMVKDEQRTWQIAQGYRRKRYTPTALFHALLAAIHMRDRGKLAETIQHSLQSAGCEPENAEQSAKMLPGRTRISESQLKIDAALCTYFAREFFAKSIGHLYLWADSSPQGGTDWLLSMLRIVPQEQLEPSAATARRLQASVQDFQLAVSNKDFALSMEIAERRHEDGVFLSKAIALHRQIPLGLGSGDSSLEKKMLCIFRKILAETQDFKLARKALRKVVCVCTDMGTEGGLSLAQGLKLTELCPAWVSDANAGLVSEDDLVNLAGGDSDSDNDESSEYFLPNSIPSPGLLHIFHNMAKDVHMKLNGFDSWVVGFKAIAALLHYKHLRNRLVATCVLGTPWEWLRGKFDTAAPKPALWRWNTITQILPRMLSLKFLLQKIWRADKFAQLFSEQNEAEGDGAEREPQDPDFKMQAVTEAIESEAWWMYTAMLQKLGSFSEDLSAWAESCSCHSWLRRTSAETAVSEDMGSAGAEVASEVSPGQYLEAARKTFGFSTGEGDGQAFQCPLAGQRAVELASGELWPLLDELEKGYVHEILAFNCCNDEEAVQSTLADLAVGKSTMVEYLRLKLQCWEALPWVMVALNHRDAAHARHLAKGALQRFDALPQASLHHRLTLKYLAAGTEGRREMEAFVGGAPLEDLPTLRKFVWSLQFAPTVERVQEGDHSIVNTFVNKRGRFSGAFVSTRLRFQEIRAVVAEPSNCRKLAACYDLVDDPDVLARQLGFSMHPLWTEAKRQKYTRRLKCQVADQVLYSLDPTTQFVSVKAAAKKRAARKKEKEKQEAAALRAFLPQAGRQRQWNIGNVERLAAAHHLQERMAPHCLYSFSEESLRFSTLCSKLRPSFQQAGVLAVADQQLTSDLSMDLCVDLDDTLEGANLSVVPAPAAAMLPPPLSSDQRMELDDVGSAVDKVVFFRVVTTHPSRRRVVKLPAAEAKRLEPEDMCVSMHGAQLLRLPRDGNASCCSDEGKLALCVSADPQSAVGIASHVHVLSCFADLSSDLLVLTQSMRCWKQGSTLLFGLKSKTVLPAAAHALLRKLVLARAFPMCSDQNCVEILSEEAETMAAAVYLQTCGAIMKRKQEGAQCDFGHLATRWCFTERGAQELIHMHEVIKPQRVFREAAVLAALPQEAAQSMTSWELMQLLNHKGWELRQKPGKTKAIKLPVLERSSPRVWYASTLHLNSKKAMAYMKALAVCENLFDSGQLLKLHHCQAEIYYAGIMEGTSNGELLEELEGGREDKAIEDVPDALGAQLSLTLDVSANTDMDDPLVRFGFVVDDEQLHQSRNEEDDSDLEIGSPRSSSYALSVWEDDDARLLQVACMGPADTGEVDGESEICLEAAAPNAAVPKPEPNSGAELEADPLLPPPAAEPHRPRIPRGQDQPSADSFNWGPFRMTWTPAEKRPPYGQWQARCPWHRLNETTACTKSKHSGPTEEDKMLALRTLQTWCLRATIHTKKRYHAADRIKEDDVLPAELLSRKLAELPAPPPADQVRTDAELDAEEGAASLTDAAAKARPKKKAKASPKDQAKAKAKPRIRKRKKSSASDKSSKSSVSGESSGRPAAESAESDDSSSSSSASNTDSSSDSSD